MMTFNVTFFSDNGPPFVRELYSYNTRSNTNDNAEVTIDLSGNLFIPLVRTTHYGLKSVKVMGPKTWNSVPRAIRKAPSRSVFVKSFKSDILLLTDKITEFI